MLLDRRPGAATVGKAAAETPEKDQRSNRRVEHQCYATRKFPQKNTWKASSHIYYNLNGSHDKCEPISFLTFVRLYLGYYTS